VRAVLDEAEFVLHVTQPWARDPNFYVEQLLSLAFTEVPVARAELGAFRERLRAVPRTLAQAQRNLVAPAGDHADMAIFNLTREDGVNAGHPARKPIPAGLIGWYEDLHARARKQQPAIAAEAEAALRAAREYHAWLVETRPAMSARAGVGAEDLDWFLRHVKMLPYSSDEVLVLAQREMERQRAFLALERHRNRELPEIALPASEAEYLQRLADTDALIRDWIVAESIISMPDYVPTDWRVMGYNVPWVEREGAPNFWEQIQYRDPAPDHLHAVIPGHRFDGWLERNNARPIRGQISFGERREGWALYLEDAAMQLGLLEERPRTRELIQAMGLWRAARTVGDVRNQRNEWTAQETIDWWVEVTPFMDAGVARRYAYMRPSPAHGLHYTMGSLQVYRLLADRYAQLGEDFVLQEFHDEYMSYGRIPNILIRYEMTGLEDDMPMLWERTRLRDHLARTGRTDHAANGGQVMKATHADLVALFQEWRAFEEPARRDGAPDYSPAAMAAKAAGLAPLQRRLHAMDTSGWPVEQQIDWQLVRAEMNGLDFRLRALQPWARDPAWYASIREAQSDTPAEEGPTIHGAVRLWQYSIWPRTALSQPAPLDADAEAALAAELRSVPPLLRQARSNLTGDARDLWLTSITSFRHQERTLARLEALTQDAGPGLRNAVEAASEATREFRAWLEVEAPQKSGASGIGRDNYTWHLRNVLLVNSTWEEEVTMMERELARSLASLRMEENRNRHLPPLEPAASADAFAQLQEESITRYMRFMAEHDILTVKPWMDRALRERVFPYSPPETRNFFGQATHREPATLWTHFYHYWDLEQMVSEPHASPIRRGALLYNIWKSRAEGVATGMEEWMLHAGLFDENPRAREIVWIMLATRAARGLASLHAHDNAIDINQASDFHVEWTPRGWMRRDLDLLGFEQQMYLRQPGYGSSYITGARLVEDIMAARAREQGDAFTLREFFDDMNAAGMIPVSLLHWQMTGDDAPVRALMD
jgi:hypothetical protein